MRIGIVGGGNIGATAARLFAAAGHEVAVANSRGPETLAGLVGELGDRARAETVEGAAEFAEVVLVAIPFVSYTDLPAAQLTGKIVIDAGNYYPSRDGHYAALDADETTSSELLAEQLPDARVVKAFNTLYWEHLRDNGAQAAGAERRALFVAGDDQEAKDRVGALIEDIGYAPVDAGSLAVGGRRLQPGGPLSGVLLTEAEATAKV
jgi:8-hydroxy-5-deazaflavin:NADPH oxidoreductase